MWVYAQCLLVCILNNVQIVQLAGVDDHDSSRRLKGGRLHGGPGTDEERVLGAGGWGTSRDQLSSLAVWPQEPP